MPSPKPLRRQEFTLKNRKKLIDSLAAATAGLQLMGPSSEVDLTELILEASMAAQMMLHSLRQQPYPVRAYGTTGQQAHDQVLNIDRSYGEQHSQVQALIKRLRELVDDDDSAWEQRMERIKVGALAMVH